MCVKLKTCVASQADALTNGRYTLQCQRRRQRVNQQASSHHTKSVSTSVGPNNAREVFYNEQDVISLKPSDCKSRRIICSVPCDIGIARFRSVRRIQSHQNRFPMNVTPLYVFE